LWIPPGFADLCCGQPWKSKGQAELAAEKKQQSLDWLQQHASQAVAIVTDASPCALQLQTEQLPLTELAAFLTQQVLPLLQIEKQPQAVMLHPTCSSQHLGQSALLRQLAEACAEQVVVPATIECCGFAGDKGFVRPELNTHALRTLPQAVPAGCHSGYSNSRTCEIGLQHHSGLPYQHLVYLLDKVSRAKDTGAAL